LVSISVWLPAIPVRFWSYKMEEMRSVMKWINDHSDVKFVIDYEGPAGTKFV